MPIPDYLPWKPNGKKLGSGGQGTVRIVIHEDDPSQTQRALKELDKPDSQQAQEQAQERFQKEIEIVKGINHPSIIKVLDHSARDDEFQFYVMEFHENAKTLEEACLSSTPNPFHGNPLKCLDLFEQIITAIQVCESRTSPIFHRDISPKNILVLPDNCIRLIDFGLCHTIGDTTITMTGENLGTRNYAPPECGSGSQFQIGTHSDIYSAAKVLWSTITSERAFDRESPIFNSKSMENMFPHDEETWHLNRLFARTIRYDPNDRYSNTEQVLLQIAEARHAINGGFPPLEAVQNRCPSCGLKAVKTARDPRQFFNTYVGRGYTTYECSMCGFIFVRGTTTLENNTKKPSQ